jgi:hypothetical protein
MPFSNNSRLNNGYCPPAAEAATDISKTLKDHQAFVQIQKPNDNYPNDEPVPKKEFDKAKGSGGRKTDPIKRLRKIAKSSSVVKVRPKKAEKKNKLLELLKTLQ